MHTKHSKGTAFQTNLFSISFEEEAFAYDLHNTYQRRKSARPETAEQIWIFFHFSWKNLNCGESSNQTHCFGPDRFPFYKSAMKFHCFSYMPYGLWNWFGLSDILSKFASKKTIFNGKSLLWWLVLTVSYGAVKAHMWQYSDWWWLECFAIKHTLNREPITFHGNYFQCEFAGSLLI